MENKHFTKTPRSVGEYRMGKVGLSICEVPEADNGPLSPAQNSGGKASHGFISLNQFQLRNSITQDDKHSNQDICSLSEKSWESHEEVAEVKRSLAYAQENCRKRDTNAVEANNRRFKEIFLGKREMTQTMSTSSSLNKIGSSSKKHAAQLGLKAFSVGPKIGSGKFGEVFFARHHDSGFICALKRISKKLMNEQLTQQLLREIKIQSCLTHPNIVKLYSFFTDQKFIYLMLEPCSYGQLYSILKKRRRISQSVTAGIMLQICEAVAYLHSNSIIHRDIKPENIICHKGMVKICDFGWSVNTSVMRETFCGTPVYVSPELLRHRGYDNKIDIWSMGILAYELMVGHVPFQICCEQDFVKIVKDEIRFPKNIDLSEVAKNFVQLCLTKDPQERVSAKTLLEHPFLSSPSVRITSEGF